METVGGLTRDLGATVLQTVSAPRGLDVPVTRLIVYDASDPIDCEPGDFVLAIGMEPGRELKRLLENVSRRGAAALAVKAPAAEAIAQDAAGLGTALIAVRLGAAWAQIILLLSALISRESIGAQGDGLSGADPGDLFAVANVVAQMVDAPVTIEDRQSRILAFSRRQDEADAARTATILGREVPVAWQRWLHEIGFFQRLARETGPIYIENKEADLLPRVAIAVRAGDEVLGSIWAVVRGPMSAEHERALAEAAGFVALHLLRHRLTSDVRGGFEKELITTVLEGGPLADDAAMRLHLGSHGFRVLALAAEEEGGSDATQLSLLRCRDMLALHLSATHPRAVTDLFGGVVYAVVPTGERTGGPPAALRETLLRFVERSAELLHMRVRIAIGPHARNVSDVPLSRAGADQVLRVLRSPYSDRAVAEVGDVGSDLLLLRFADACRDDPSLSTGPLIALRDHDRKYRTAYVQTLRAYLDCFGNVEQMAQELKVHENTVRYRVRQMQSLVDLNLSDASSRLTLMLQLRLLPLLSPADESAST